MGSFIFTVFPELVSVVFREKSVGSFIFTVFPELVSVVFRRRVWVLSFLMLFL